MALIILSEALPSPYELTALTIDSYTSLSQLNCLLSSNSCIYHRITQLFKASLTLSLIRHNIPTSPQHYCHHLILKNVCSAVNGPTYTTSIPMASRIMPPWSLPLHSFVLPLMGSGGGAALLVYRVSYLQIYS